MGADTGWECLLAIPFGIPMSVNSEEFFWQLETLVFKKLGLTAKARNSLRAAAVDRWMAGEPFGIWAFWLAQELLSQLRCGRK